MLQALYNLVDDNVEYLIRGRLSFMRFLRLRLHDRVPNAKTILLYREALSSMIRSASSRVVNGPGASRGTS